MLFSHVLYVDEKPGIAAAGNVLHPVVLLMHVHMHEQAHMGVAAWRGWRACAQELCLYAGYMCKPNTFKPS